MCSFRVSDTNGRLDIKAKAEVPISARHISAAFCPAINMTEPEYISMGSEDTAVYIYDISRGKRHAAVVNKLQVDARQGCNALSQLYICFCLAFCSTLDGASSSATIANTLQSCQIFSISPLPSFLLLALSPQTVIYRLNASPFFSLLDNVERRKFT